VALARTADAVFDALGEPVRRRILELLREGPTPVGRLAERLPVGRPAVSKHLRVLSNAGLIEHRSAGTRNLYALAPDGMAAAQQWLVGTWDTALAEYDHGWPLVLGRYHEHLADGPWQVMMAAGS
jgi:DNA-binding transcriptional ArsR family regulator